MIYEVMAGIATVSAAVPAGVFVRNLLLYKTPPLSMGSRSRISVLIPARNEQHTISEAISSVLASIEVDLELIVLDDHSGDETAAVVKSLARHDPRVRVQSSFPLPEGWCGKQFACWQLSQLASHDLLCFLDADVRLSPDALHRMAASMKETGTNLLSGFPRQRAVTFLEKLLIPLIHFVLLGFLPLGRMRQSTHPAYAAGCGQLMLVEKKAYCDTNGHSAIRATLHDGIKLPRVFRLAGWKTDLVDLTELASCRMYRNASEVWFGLAKNATEGLAAPARIVPITLVLLAGQVLPLYLAIAATLGSVPATASAAALLALALCYLPRVLAVRRFRQNPLSAMLHPFGVLTLITLQWFALIKLLFGRPASWKGRSYLGSLSTPAQ